MTKKKIKVLHISQVSGGIQTYLEQIFQNIDREKFEIILACAEERKSLISTAKKHNIQVIELNLKHHISPIFDLLGIISIIKTVKKIKPDIIHAHSSKAGILTRIAGIFFSPKILYTPNAYAYIGQKGLKRTVLLFIEKIGKYFTFILLASSKSEANRSIQDIKFPAKKVLVFPNSIEILEPLVKADKFSKPVKTITMIGRLVKQKNPLMFMEVCKIVCSKRKDVVFQIIGAGFDDQLKKQMEAFIDANNLNDSMSIVFWMDREDMLEKIRETAVFVMTSNFESFGYVAAEAQMLEIPVVATNVDGLNEVVADGSTGYLVELNDSNAMADKIMFLLDNTKIAEEMGKAGRPRIISKFHIKKNIKILEDIYSQYSKP